MDSISTPADAKRVALRGTGRALERVVLLFVCASIAILLASLILPFDLKWVRGTPEPGGKTGWWTRYFVLRNGAFRYVVGDVYLSHDGVPPVPGVVNQFDARWSEASTTWIVWPQTRSVIDYAIPLWPLPIATGSLWIWMRSHRRRLEREAAQGLCRRCGYDLRATPDRCPECGQLASSA